jgi:hypothetical protein
MSDSESKTQELEQVMVTDDKTKKLVETKKMNDSANLWKAKVKTLTEKLKGDIKYASDIQAEAISFRQDVVDEVKVYAVKIHKLMQKMKVLEKQRFEFYALSYQVKTSGSEKVKLINADLAAYQEFIDEMDEHVNLLRDTSKNLESINYAVKSKIELANILGGYR